MSYNLTVLVMKDGLMCFTAGVEIKGQLILPKNILLIINAIIKAGIIVTNRPSGIFSF